MDELVNLIAAAYDPKTSHAFAQFVPSDADLRDLAEVGKDVLQNFPSKPGACGPMSAMYLARWEMQPRPRMFMVAGELYADGTRVFGHDNMGSTINEEIRKSNLSWDGHFWLVFGLYTVDVSIFRTAYSGYSPPALAAHVHRVCGKQKGLLIANKTGLDEVGFRYVPHAILSSDQVDGYCHGARALFET